MSESIRVKAWAKGQGDFVDIEAAAFDPKVHERYEPEQDDDEAPKKRASTAKAKASEVK